MADTQTEDLGDRGQAPRTPAEQILEVWDAYRQDDDSGEIYWAIHRRNEYDFITNVYDEGHAGRCKERALMIAAAPEMMRALAGMLDTFGGYVTPEVDAAISAMQKAGVDRWSMEAQMKATGKP